MRAATAPSGQPAAEALTAALAGFTAAAESLLQDRALLRRVDRKYLLAARHLPALLGVLTRGHHLLHAAGHPVATYRTEYFDTPDRQSYDDHRRGRRPRCKVRIRHHLERRVSFLEVKQKQPDGRTAKWRLPRLFGNDDLDDAARRFIAEHCPLPAAALTGAASITFRRITLLALDTEERITVDHDVVMQCGPRRHRFEDLAIVEVKQARFSSSTDVLGALRAVRAREQSISKYCVAVARLAPVRANSFKPGLRAIQQLSV